MPSYHPTNETTAQVSRRTTRERHKMVLSCPSEKTFCICWWKLSKYRIFGFGSKKCNQVFVFGRRETRKSALFCPSSLLDEPRIPERNEIRDKIELESKIEIFSEQMCKILFYFKLLYFCNGFVFSRFYFGDWNVIVI